MTEVLKVWGKETWLVNTELYCAKRLEVTKGFRCSYHRHHVKDETFIVVHGRVLLEHEGTVHVMGQGDKRRIFPGQWHRFGGLDAQNVILEVSTHHDDADVERQEPSGRMPDFRT